MEFEFYLNISPDLYNFDLQIGYLLLMTNLYKLFIFIIINA